MKIQDKYLPLEQNWLLYKGMEILINFLNNHNSEIEDSDTFDLLSRIYSSQEWMTKIKEAIPDKIIKKMLKEKIYRAKLDFDDDIPEIARTIWFNDYARKYFKEFMAKEFISFKESHQDIDDTKETIPNKLEQLAELLDLTSVEKDILLIYYLKAAELLHFSYGCNTNGTIADKINFIAKCLNASYLEIQEAFKENSKLMRYECIIKEYNHLDFKYKDFIENPLTKDISQSFFYENLEAALPLNYYSNDIKVHAKRLGKMLTSNSSNKGMNILLYGTPGTGKSSFAITLAKEFSKKAYNIYQNFHDDKSDTSTANFRFAALQICDSRVTANQSIVIVDEADDMLNAYGEQGNKGRLNTILDNVKTPIIWISNNSRGELDLSTRRRFDYSIYFEPLSSAQREVIWQNCIKEEKLGKLIKKDLIKKLSEKYDVTCGVIALVLRNLKRLEVKGKEVESELTALLDQHCELLDIKVDKKTTILASSNYSLEGVNTKGDVSLDKIVKAVRNYQSNKFANTLDTPRMNILLSGPPGTGKTEFVKYLGETLKTKVVTCMGSDLLNCYVGETEQNIKRAFKRAAEEKAILFLDEIDGLVQNRQMAHNSWEVTQVNEILHQMENFNGIMVGATNFVKNLDSAILRRFTFKMEFDFLTNEGKAIFFKKFFATPLSQEESLKLNSLTFLTPGDFRTVRQSLFYLDEEVTNSTRLQLLEQESKAKKSFVCPSEVKIGFSA
jgi:SpoVK/Ycf46/Vps4 family AAA+-type ATPase